MSDLMVQPESVGELAESLSANADQIQAILDELSAQTQALRGQWSGEASNAFTDAERRWQVMAEELRTVLTGVSGSTRTTADMYVQADEAVAGIWSL